MNYALSLILFAATLFWAQYAQWDAADLMWSFWICSLAVGYTQILWGIAALMKKSEAIKVSQGTKIGAAFGLFVFFSFHFIFFHFVHSGFLYAFFPIPDLAQSKPSADPGFIQLVAYCLTEYWLVNFAGVILQLSQAISRASAPATTTKQAAPLARSMNASMMAPYASVVRLHILIILTGFLMAAKLEQFALWLALIVFFFPFELIRRNRADNTR